MFSLRLAPLSLCLLAAAWLAPTSGCVSASGAYRDGMAAETAGDYDGAVRRYATALALDAGLPNVRGRLVVAAREAVRRHLASAAAAPDALGAADAWLDAEAVVAEARAVGVDAERPPTFADDRDAALDAAIYTLLGHAAADVDAADYAGALARLDRARAYRPAPSRQAELDAAAQTAYHYWAEDDLAAGRFRSALAHADAALGTAPAGPDLTALRAEILAAGEQRVAVLPVRPDAAGDYPERWLLDLGDTLDETLVATNAPFLAFADPAETRRVLRGAGVPAAPIARAAWTAERVGADVAVLIRLDAPAETQRPAGRQRVAARFRDGARDTTSYVRETVERRVETSAEITVVSAYSGEPVCGETVRADATERVRRATFTGDWRRLDLGAAERALFDRDTPGRAATQALTDLRGVLAGRLAERAVVCLGRQVP